MAHSLAPGVRVKEVGFGEHTEQIFGGLLGAGHESYLVAHRQLNHARQQRVVSAAEDNRVDVGLLQRFEISLRKTQDLPAAGDSAFDEIDESRTGDGGDLGVAGGSERVLICLLYTSPSPRD